MSACDFAGCKNSASSVAGNEIDGTDLRRQFIRTAGGKHRRKPADTLFHRCDLPVRLTDLHRPMFMRLKNILINC
jgi:hypothetical protein